MAIKEKMLGWGAVVLSALIVMDFLKVYLLG